MYAHVCLVCYVTVSAKKQVENEERQRESTMKLLTMTVKKKKNKQQMKRLMQSMPSKCRVKSKPGLKK